VSPFSELSPREALWMAEAKQSEAWNHTAALLCGMASMFSDKPLSPIDFHPMAKNKQPAGQPWSETKANIAKLVNHGVKRG